MWGPRRTRTVRGKGDGVGGDDDGVMGGSGFWVRVGVVVVGGDNDGAGDGTSGLRFCVHGWRKKWAGWLAREKGVDTSRLNHPSRPFGVHGIDGG